MGSRGGFHVTHSSSHRLRMSFSSYLLCWVLSTGWMRVSVGRPMTSESEHCCRDSRGRTAAATGSGSTRTGPWPSPWACRHRPWHPSPSHRCRLFSFWGACSVPAAPAGRGAQCVCVPFPHPAYPKIRPDPVGFRFPRHQQEGTQISKNANPSCSCRVANSKSRKFDKKSDCASYTAAPTASLRAFKNKRISNFGGLQARTFASVSEKPDQREHNTTRRGTAHTSRRPLAYSCSRPDLQSVSTHPR